MLIYLPALLCLVLAFVLYVLSRRPRFRYIWLVSALGALGVFGLVVAAWLINPLDVGSARFSLVSIFNSGFQIRWDAFSASLSIAVAAVLLAVVLSDVQRSAASDWRAYGSSFLAAGVALGGLPAGNFFTLLLFMGLADLVITGVLFAINLDQPRIGLAIQGFTYRGGGLLLIVLVALLQIGLGPDTGGAIELLLLGILLLGFYLRLGVAPAGWASFAEPERNSGLGTMLRVSLAGLAFLLLLRLDLATLASGGLNPILLLVALPSAIAAWGWLQAHDEVAGRSYFFASGASLLVAAVLLGLTDSGLAWAMVLILSGAVLFLFRTRRSWFVLLPFLGFWGLTGLPLSVGWSVMQIYSPPFPPAILTLLPVQAILLTGYLLHTLRVDPGDIQMERWEQFLYPLGLAVLPVSNLFVVWLPWRGLESLQGIPWWPGFVATALGAGLWWLAQRQHLPEIHLPNRLKQFRTFLGGAGLEILSWINRVINFVSFLLEGQGGVLWALLILALMITVLAQLSLNVAGNGS